MGKVVELGRVPKGSGLYAALVVWNLLSIEKERRRRK